MRGVAWTCAAALALAALACFGSGESQMESTFSGRMQELDGLIARADEPLKGELARQKADFLREYAGLPQGDARADGLGKLNQRSRAAIEVATPRVEAQKAGAGPAGPAAPGAPGGAVTVREASYGKSLGDHNQAVGPTTQFLPTEKVCLSVVVPGRPRAGKVGARFMYRDTLLAETTVDLSDVNGGLLFSFGEDTWIGFSFTPAKAMWVGTRYRTDVDFNGQKLGSYPFGIAAPPGSLPAKVTSAVLAKGVTPDFQPVGPSAVFAKGETVNLVVRGDVGVQSWAEGNLYVNGVHAEAATKSLTFLENAPGTGYAFSFAPDAGGWPAGSHEVTLTVNDADVGRYPFTVAP